MLQIKLTGISALLMKNPQLADPENEIVQEIKTITAKGSKMTAEDRAQKSKLQWFGALYVNNGELFIPSTMVLRCFAEAGKITRNGTDVERALATPEARFPLEYPGAPRDVNELWKDLAYRYETMVNGNPSQGRKKSMIPSTRPIFTKWSLTTTWELFEKALDYSRFLEIVEAGGRSQGIGDNRRNGFGRFTAVVTKL